MQHKRKKSGGIIWMILASLFVAAVIFVLRESIAHYDTSNHRDETFWQALFSYEFAEQFRTHAFAVLLVLWIFAFGASIGSFLNVVVYRVPRGESLNKRGSHCPYCNQAIRLRDNIPVLGWINLRGRCHVCRLPISSRYPVVEFLTGSAFVFFFLYEVAAGGSFLPLTDQIQARDGMIGIFSRSFEEFRLLLGTYALHMFCVSVLWSAALIERDRHRVPLKLFVVPLVIGLCAATFWPEMLPLSWFVDSRLSSLSDEFQRIVRHFSPVIGFIIGTGQGLLLSRFMDAQHDNSAGAAQNVNFAIACGLVGVTFGWQAILLISLPLVILLYFVRAAQIGRESRVAFDRFGLLLLLTLLHWVGWKIAYGRFEVQLSGAPYLFYGLIALGLAAAFRFSPPISERSAGDSTCES